MIILGVTEIVSSSNPSLINSIAGTSINVAISPAKTAIKHMVIASKITEVNIVKSL